MECLQWNIRIKLCRVIVWHNKEHQDNNCFNSMQDLTKTGENCKIKKLQNHQFIGKYQKIINILASIFNTRTMIEIF